MKCHVFYITRSPERINLALAEEFTVWEVLHLDLSPTQPIIIHKLRVGSSVGCSLARACGNSMDVSEETSATIFEVKSDFSSWS